MVNVTEQMLLMGHKLRVWKYSMPVYDETNPLKKQQARGVGDNINSMNEPPPGKTNNVVSEQVRHKQACTVKKAG